MEVIRIGGGDHVDRVAEAGLGVLRLSSSFALPSSDQVASSSPWATASSTAWMPGPPVLVIMPMRRPRGGSCSGKSDRRLDHLVGVVKLHHPGLLIHGRGHACLVDQGPGVRAETATEPSRVRPALMARIGLWGVIRDATSRKAVGVLEALGLHHDARVPSSWP